MGDCVRVSVCKCAYACQCYVHCQAHGIAWGHVLKGPSRPCLLLQQPAEMKRDCVCIHTYVGVCVRMYIVRGRFTLQRCLCMATKCVGVRVNTYASCQGHCHASGVPVRMVGGCVSRYIHVYVCVGICT